MFPDLTRDDVFRLETPRLWLRWPAVADAPMITQFAGDKQVAEMTATWPHPLPEGEVARRIFNMRKQNALGNGLMLVLALKQKPYQVIGSIGGNFRSASTFSFGYMLDPEFWGEGLMTEAVQAMMDTVFTLTDASEVEAGVRVINPLSRRVLEKAGFQSHGSSLVVMPGRGGRLPCDQFCLGRSTWNALKSWRSPGFERISIDVGITALEAGIAARQLAASSRDAYLPT